MSDLSVRERLRVEWIVFYYTTGQENAALTARYSDISRKTFHKWLRRFKDSKYDVDSLADRSEAPQHRRKGEVTIVQEDRIRRLKKKYPCNGKQKVKVLH